MRGVRRVNVDIDFERLLATLVSSNVEFIVVGGVAAYLHGSARLTSDLDIVYRRTQENITRLVSALAPLSPYLRGAPPGLPFRLDSNTLQRGLNFTLTTSLGDLDLLGEIAGGGSYDNIRKHAQEVMLYGVGCLCLELDKLIEVKRAAGRLKDFEVIAELEALREEGKR